VPTNSKRPPRYDLKKQDRRRNVLVQLGLVSIVVIFAVALVLYIVLGHEKKPASGEQKAIRVTSSKLITKEGSKDPKAVMSIYEDFLCPHCAEFEKAMGPTVTQLIDSGAIAADYTMVDIVGANAHVDYSKRSGGAAYCVADQSIDAFRRFHAALFAQQPSETARSFPDNSQLIETARQAGASGKVPDCIKSGRYVPLVEGASQANGVTQTPTIRINGEDYKYSTPQALIDKIKSIVGNVPGLEAPAPAQQ
jgi:protein-disulfide isomerase